MTEYPFSDRGEAGLQLGRRLRELPELGADSLVLALPRGGVPVAVEVATALGAELDLLLVRKIGAPGDPELAVGAIAEPASRWLNQPLIDQLGVSAAQLESEIQVQQRELERRARVYRGERRQPAVRGRCVVLVDDGIATGATMSAAILALRQLHPARVIVAVPAAPADVCAKLERDADRLICLWQPMPFRAVGACYRRFEQVEDAEVTRLLAGYAAARSARV